MKTLNTNLAVISQVKDIVDAKIDNAVTRYVDQVSINTEQTLVAEKTAKSLSEAVKSKQVKAISDLFFTPPHMPNIAEIRANPELLHYKDADGKWQLSKNAEDLLCTYHPMLYTHDMKRFTTLFHPGDFVSGAIDSKLDVLQNLSKKLDVPCAAFLTGVLAISSLFPIPGFAVYGAVFAANAFFKNAVNRNTDLSPFSGMLGGWKKNVLWLSLFTIAPGFSAIAKAFSLMLDANKALKADEALIRQRKAAVEGKLALADEIDLDFEETRETSLPIRQWLDIAHGMGNVYQRHNVISEAKIDRFKQLRFAASDRSPLIDLNLTATGMLAKDGDFFAPDPGKRMKLSMRDLCTHFMVVGNTGTGKTEQLRRTTDQLMALPKSQWGCFVCDEKATLQKEFKDRYKNEFYLINPEHEVFAPLEGLNAEEAAEALVDCFISKDTPIDFWVGSGKQLIDQAMVLLEITCMMKNATVAGRFQTGRTPQERAARTKVVAQAEPAEWTWSLKSVAELLSDEKLLQQMCNDINLSFMKEDAYRYFMINNPALRQELRDLNRLIARAEAAKEFFENNYLVMAENTRSGIKATATEWLSKPLSNRAIQPWMVAETGFCVEDILTKGLRAGMWLSQSEYGETGRFMERFARARLYKTLFLRADNNPNDPYVTIFWDEIVAGLGTGEAEAKVASQARSKKVGLWAMTQSFSALQAQLGNDKAEAFLTNFRNLVVFKTNSATLEQISRTSGSIYRLRTVYTATWSNVNRTSKALMTSEAKNGILGFDFVGYVKKIEESNIVDGDEMEAVRAGFGTEEVGGDAGKEMLHEPIFYPDPVTCDIEPTFSQELFKEVDSIEKCYVQLNRSGSPLRDICRLSR